MRVDSSSQNDCVPIGPVRRGAPVLSPLRHIDAAVVSEAARRESRARETFLPPVSVYRWWARRTDAVIGAIIEAAQQDNPELTTVCDPFSGGGVVALSALRRGLNVYAQDINPWAAAGLLAATGLPAPRDIRKATALLHEVATPMLTKAYATTTRDGLDAEISHTLWVAVVTCPRCLKPIRLFPHAHVSLLRRRESNCREAWLACPLGHLSVGVLGENGTCGECGRPIVSGAAYTARRRFTCPHCDADAALGDVMSDGQWHWEPAMVERRSLHGRMLDLPTPEEVAQAESAEWSSRRTLKAIPESREARVLLRHGFSSWGDIYPNRQAHVLDQLLTLADGLEVETSLRACLKLAIIGSCEMAGHLSRWDRWYLKSYEAMAGHRFNFTTLSAEPNVWGIESRGRGTVLRRLHSFAIAADWMNEEVGTRCVSAAGATPDSCEGPVRLIVGQGDSASLALADHSIELVVTDPPYHDDVEYDVLSLPFQAWMDVPADAEASTHAASYKVSLTGVFSEVKRVLRIDGAMILSFANRDPNAWTDCLSALESAGFHCRGFQIVHAENETDHAKRGRRACNYDLLLDLVPSAPPEGSTFVPEEPPLDDVEARFLYLIGTVAIRVGNLGEDWKGEFTRSLIKHEFLGDKKAIQKSLDAKQSHPE